MIMTEETPVLKNISQRKLSIVESASFDTLIAALLKKSEKAQVTFVYRYMKEANGEVLAMIIKYAQAEVVKRAKAGRDTDVG
jgi:hypothetical protein